MAVRLNVLDLNAGGQNAEELMVEALDKVGWTTKKTCYFSLQAKNIQFFYDKRLEKIKLWQKFKKKLM
jgi:hypothetical protein